MRRVAPAATCCIRFAPHSRRTLRSARSAASCATSSASTRRPDSPPFVHRLRVRYHECDAQGVVFNANHFAYFDVTLTELWRAAFGSYDTMVAAGTDVVVVNAEASFLGPVRFDDEIELHFTIAKLGNTSMTSEIEERRDGETLVQGRIVHVFVDTATMEKKPVPDEMREKLAPWVRAE